MNWSMKWAALFFLPLSSYCDFQMFFFSFPIFFILWKKKKKKGYDLNLLFNSSVTIIISIFGLYYFIILLSNMTWICHYHYSNSFFFFLLITFHLLISQYQVKIYKALSMYIYMIKRSRGEFSIRPNVLLLDYMECHLKINW